MKLRLIGQLILTKVVEVSILNGWRVISTNTDGIEVIINDGEFEAYKEALKSVEKQFNLELEHEVYSKIVYKNVNNYIAISQSGSVKRKGFFKMKFNEKGQREIPLGDSTNEIVVPICLNLFYTKGIKPEVVLQNPEEYKLHIFDFCRSNKIAKNYQVSWNGEPQQRLNRYYVSKGAPYLYKQKEGKKTLENVLDGWGVELYNEHKDKPLDEYGIDMRYYLSKVNDIILDINRKNQLRLDF